MLRILPGVSLLALGVVLGLPAPSSACLNAMQDGSAGVGIGLFWFAGSMVAVPAIALLWRRRFLLRAVVAVGVLVPATLLGIALGARPPDWDLAVLAVVPCALVATEVYRMRRARRSGGSSGAPTAAAEAPRVSSA